MGASGCQAIELPKKRLQSQPDRVAGVEIGGDAVGLGCCKRLVERTSKLGTGAGAAEKYKQQESYRTHLDSLVNPRFPVCAAQPLLSRAGTGQTGLQRSIHSVGDKGCPIIWMRTLGLDRFHCFQEADSPAWMVFVERLTDSSAA